MDTYSSSHRITVQFTCVWTCVGREDIAEQSSHNNKAFCQIIYVHAAPPSLKQQVLEQKYRAVHFDLCWGKDCDPRLNTTFKRTTQNIQQAYRTVHGCCAAPWLTYLSRIKTKLLRVGAHPHPALLQPLYHINNVTFPNNKRSSRERVKIQLLKN